VFPVRRDSELLWSLAPTFPSLLPVRNFSLDDSFGYYLSCYILQAARTLRNLKSFSSESLREKPWMTHPLLPRHLFVSVTRVAQLLHVREVPQAVFRGIEAL
jgi:hypothetical protein